jgi:Na+/H+-dicarboxylate symporter
MLGIDRIPDMMRSAVNLLSQVSTAVLVDRWTGGKRSKPGQ